MENYTEYRQYKKTEPEWLKEFDNLINNFFDIRNYYKTPEKNTEKIEMKGK